MILLEYLQDIGRKFDLNPDEFSPISTWFSYGSNLFRQDFERKMRDHGSNLTLVRARRSRLSGWTRRLDNESSTRGLAYSIRNETQHFFVDGIVHDVPIGDLAAFLQFEGVLDEDYQLKYEGERRYDIQKLAVQLFSPDGTIAKCFALVGRCAVVDQSKKEEIIRKHRRKLIDYVRTSIKGAIDFEINIAPFQEDLKRIESLR